MIDGFESRPGVHAWQGEHLGKWLHAASLAYKVTGDEKVTIFNDSKITEVFGGKFVEGVKIKTPRSEEVLEVEGVFVEIGLVPNSGFTQGLDKNKHGEIIINCQTETNVKGVFAAGDVTNVIEKQIIVAAGEGAKASLQTFRYLARKK